MPGPEDISTQDQDDAGLSDAEREAILGDTTNDDGGDDKAADAATTGDDESKGGGDAAPEQKEEAQDNAGDEGEKADAGSAADKSDDGDEEVKEPEPFVPLLAEKGDEDPEKVLETTATRLSEIKTERRELLAKFRNGDIDADDYDVALEVLDDEKDELNVQRADLRAKATVAKERAEFNRQMREQKWNFDMQRFVDRNPAFQDRRNADELKRTISEDISRRDDAKGKPYSWFIEEAGKLMAERYEDVTLGAKRSRGKQKVDEAPAPKSKKPEPVKTLGDIDAGAGDGEVPRDEEFADLDNLTGMALERALDAMDSGTAGKYLDTSRLHS